MRAWRGSGAHLDLTRPDVRRGILDELFGEIALDTTNEVVLPGLLAFADDSEEVVFPDRATRYPREHALLHASLEVENSDLGRGLRRGRESAPGRNSGVGSTRLSTHDLNMNLDFPCGYPGRNGEERHPDDEIQVLLPEYLRACYPSMTLKIVKVAEQHEDPRYQDRLT